jgi:hypothetical protein
VIYCGCIREKSLIFALSGGKKTAEVGKFAGKMLLYTVSVFGCDLKFVDCMLAAVSENDKLVRFKSLLRVA